IDERPVIAVGSVPAVETNSSGIAIAVTVAKPAVAVRGGGDGVNPGLGRIAAHHADGFLLRLAPCEENPLLRHPAADFSLADQRLLLWRKLTECGLVRFDARGDRAAARNNHRARCDARQQRPRKQLTLHASKVGDP